MEAEYIASSEATKEALWLRRLMAEIRGSSQVTEGHAVNDAHDMDIWEQWGSLFPSVSVSSPQLKRDSQVIFADNQSAIKLSENPRHHNRTKHIDVKYHFIREASQQGLIKLIYIPTTDMVADILTKSLPRDKHEKQMRSMGMC